MTPESFEGRVFDKFDSLCNKIDDLRERTTRTEEKLDAHLEQSNKKQVSRRQFVFIILGIVGSYAVGVFTKLTGG